MQAQPSYPMPYEDYRASQSAEYKQLRETNAPPPQQQQQQQLHRSPTPDYVNGAKLPSFEQRIAGGQVPMQSPQAPPQRSGYGSPHNEPQQAPQQADQQRQQQQPQHQRRQSQPSEYVEVHDESPAQQDSYDSYRGDGHHQQQQAHPGEYADTPPQHRRAPVRVQAQAPPLDLRGLTVRHTRNIATAKELEQWQCFGSLAPYCYPTAGIFRSALSSCLSKTTLRQCRL